MSRLALATLCLLPACRWDWGRFEGSGGGTGGGTGGQGGVGGPVAGCENAARPKATVDTSYTKPQGKTITLKAGEDLQAALDVVAPGETLALEAGATWSGRYVVRAKSGDAWIHVTTTGLASLPAPGTRVGPANAPQMARIRPPAVDRALVFEPGAHHVRFVGLEITTAHADRTRAVGALVELGTDPNTDQEANVAAELPHDIIFDRCFIHGTETGNIGNLIAANAVSFGLVDSYLSEAHRTDGLSAAVAIWNSPGPFAIVNNRLEAAGMNVMLSRANPASAAMIPADIELRRNHVTKRLTWRPGDPSYAGVAWKTFTLIDFGFARRALIEGNVLEETWPSADTGGGLAVTLASYNESNNTPFVVVEDVTFARNIVRRVGAGMLLAGTDGGNPGMPAHNLCIRDNLFEDVAAGTGGGTAHAFYVNKGGGGMTKVWIAHNTVLLGARGGAFIFAGDDPIVAADFRMDDNIATHAMYGAIGTGVGSGTAMLEAFFEPWSFAKNLIIGGNPDRADYPAGTLFAASVADVRFVAPGTDYRLHDESLYKKAGSDGTDIGADMDAVYTATQGVAEP